MFEMILAPRSSLIVVHEKMVTLFGVLHTGLNEY